MSLDKSPRVQRIPLDGESYRDCFFGDTPQCDPKECKKRKDLRREFCNLVQVEIAIER